MTSVAAFLARARSGADPQAARVCAALDLDDEARAVAQAQGVPVAQRMAWMAERTGRAWTPAQLAHAELRAFVTIRRQLQAHGLWRAAP